MGKETSALGVKLTLIQLPSTTLDGTLQTSCPMICLLNETVILLLLGECTQHEVSHLVSKQMLGMLNTMSFDL